MTTHSPRIIAFSGKKGSGKSTCVEYLNETNSCLILSFAQPLKNLVRDVFLLTEDQVYDPVFKEQLDKYWNVTPRELLQKIGTEMFRNQLSTLFPQIRMSHNSIWVSRMYRCIQDELQLQKNTGVIRDILIDDCRFEDEYEMLTQIGGIVIRINRGEQSDMDSSHESEKGCSYTHEIENTGSLERLYNSIDEILERL